MSPTPASRRLPIMFVVGAIVVIVLGYVLLWVATPSMNLLLCESREYDSSYGEASLQLVPPAVRCDFSGDRFYPEQGAEDRATWLLVLAPVVFLAGSWAVGVVVGRRETQPQSHSSP